MTFPKSKHRAIFFVQTIININDCSPTIAIYTGGFNTRNSEWWDGDFTNLQGTELAELATQFGLNQVIDGATHILPNSASCIDLIFTTETNSGVLPSVFLRCHYQSIFDKLVSLLFFLPPTGGESWISQGLTSMLSGKLLIALIGIGHSTA